MKIFIQLILLRGLVFSFSLTYVCLMFPKRNTHINRYCLYEKYGYMKKETKNRCYLKLMFRTMGALAQPKRHGTLRTHLKNNLPYNITKSRFVIGILVSY